MCELKTLNSYGELGVGSWELGIGHWEYPFQVIADNDCDLESSSLGINITQSQDTAVPCPYN